MGIWEHNCAVLRERFHPGLLEAVTRDEPDTTELKAELKIETAASGKPTLVINGLYVHSPRDPEREGRRLAEASLAEASLAETANGTVVILGFGLGYAAQAVAELSPQTPIIIVEKRLSVLRAALELRDLSSLFSPPRHIALIPGGDGLEINTILSFFEKTTGQSSGQSSGHGAAASAARVIRNRTLIALDEQWYASIESRLRAWAMKEDTNRATLHKFGKRWIRNLSRNMSAIRDLPGIARLAGLAAQGEPAALEVPVAEPLPVFLAAAGPGLDSVAPFLPEIRKRCIIVAVDTSLRFLLRSGVDPDFTLVVDPQFWNNRHLDRCAGERTRLVAESAVYPPVLRLAGPPADVFKETYLCGSLFPLGAFIEQRVDPKGALGAGGSVATSAWDFSRILGARQIWIAGLDLAFPGLKTHCKGARFEEKALAESGRLNPAETWLLHALRGGFPFNAPSISGGQVLTDRRLSLYAAWFESCFRQFPAIRSYSLSPDGLNIAGLEQAEPEALLALPERRAEIDSRLEAATARIKAAFFEPQEARQRGERYENALAALHSGLNQISGACKKGIQTAEQALRRRPKPAEREKTLAALGEINRCIFESEVKEIAGFLFPLYEQALAAPVPGKTTEELTAEATSTGPNVLFRRHLESSLHLYRSLLEAAVLPSIVPSVLP